MGLFNRKKLVALTGVATPKAEPKRDARARFLTGNQEQQQEQRLEALEDMIKVLTAKVARLQKESETGGCKCATKEPEVKSVTKAKPKK